MSDLKFNPAAWQDRVTVAQEAGRELGTLSHRLNGIASQNYLGLDCEEGAALFVSLRRLIKTGTAALDEMSQAAGTLGTTASAATVQIPDVDEKSGLGILRNSPP